MDYTTLEKIVRDHEKPSRFEHSLGVVEVSEVLARRFRLDVELARMAAIFHDFNRYMDGQSLLSFCLDHKIPVEEEEKAAPMLLHGAVAAWYFPVVTGIKDERVVRAIRHHTLASPEMGALGAVIYVADYSEKGRRHLDDNDRLAIWGHGSLEEMVLDVIAREEAYSAAVDRPLAAVTVRCRDFLKEGGRLAR